MTSTKNSETKFPFRVLMVLLDAPPSQLGGAEIQAWNLSQQLLAQGMQVNILTKKTFREKQKEQQYEGITIYRIAFFLPYLITIISRFQRRIFNKIFPPNKELQYIYGKVWGCDAYMYGTIFFFSALLFFWKHKKQFDILHVHTIEWLAPVVTILGIIFKKKIIIKDSTMNGFEKLRFTIGGKFFQKIMIQHCYFIAMTNFIEQNFLKNGIPKEKIFRIPNGINISSDVSSIVEEQYTCLFVGNLYQEPAKGMDILLGAWKEVVVKYPTAILKIVGQGNIKKYENDAKELGISKNVVFYGKQNNVSDFLKTATIFVLPSRREGMSNALMEAMLYGKPCIATDISGNQDLIQNGENGILVPVNNKNELAKAILYLLKNDEIRKRIREKAKITIEKNYMIEHIASKYIQTYNTIFNENTLY